MMLFSEFAYYLEKLEKTTSRLEMTHLLAKLFGKAGVDEVDKICYLLQGRVAPLFEAVEFGMADKMVIKAISKAVDVSKKKVNEIFRKKGDLGATIEVLKSLPTTRQKPFSTGKRTKALQPSWKKLKIQDVYKELLKIARAGGEGSVDEKINATANLLATIDPLSSRYLVRIPLSKLRLGFSDMTILDSLSWMISGNKSLRKDIEKAYHVRPDLGFIAKVVKEKGIGALAATKPSVGTPILMARAERLTSAQEIIDQIGKCAIEYKYDGFRLQIHKNGKEVFLFSRNLENVTHMYPDIVEGVQKQVKVQKAIFEGEAIAYNPDTWEYLPFQETVQRRRKYNIEKMRALIPLRLFAFEALLVEDKNLIHEHFVKRRKFLENILRKGETMLLADEKITDDPQELELMFEDAVTRGLEGIMAKRLDGTYQAGARSWNWIKYKRSYSGKLADTIDCLVMGYDYGQGKRAGFGIGGFLGGIYDEDADLFKTVAKIGTGLTDEQWLNLQKRCNKIKASEKPPLYVVDRLIEPDVWVEPEIVVEIRADEITKSPVHTAGRVMGPSKTGKAKIVKVAGFALRFPRLEKFRDDKNPQEITALKEVEKMYNLQLKK